MKNSMMSGGRGASNGIAQLEFHALEPHQAVVQKYSYRKAISPPMLRVNLLKALTCLIYLALGTLIVLSAPLPTMAQLTQELQMGLESQKSGNLKDAIEIYNAVIAKNKQSAEAHNWRGMAYDDLNQPDKALADFDEAIRISPKYADAYNNRGEVYRKKNMLRQAETDYRKAAELDKTFAEAHYNLGLIFEQEGKVPQAVRAFSDYLKLKPAAEDKEEVQARIAALQKPAAQAHKPPAPAGRPPAAVEPPKPQAPGATQPPAAEAPKPQAREPEQTPATQPPTTKPPKTQAPAPKPPTPGATKVEGEKKLPPKPSVSVVPPIPSALEQAIPQGMPGMSQEDLNKVLNTVAGMGYVSIIINVLYYLFTAVMLFLIATKTGTGLPWLAFIPIANIVLMVQIARKPLWWLALLLLLPIVSVVLMAMIAVDPTGGYLAGLLAAAAFVVCILAWLSVNLGISQARGKSALWGVLLFIPCTNPIALGYLGLSR